jgi:hypothetical protein
MIRYLLAVLSLVAAGPVSSAGDPGDWNATGFAKLDDAAAVPYLTDAGRSHYQEFLKHPSPRAFVICPTGGFTTIYGGNAGLERELKKRASGCEPYVINDAVVWKGNGAAAPSTAGKGAVSPETAGKSVAPPATASIVECRDATGRKEFGQECPPGTTYVRDVKTSGGLTATPGAHAPNKSVQQLETEFQQRRIAREAEEAAEKQQKAQAQLNCNDALVRLSVLENGRRIRLAGKTGADGGPVFMEDDSRTAEIEAQRKRLQGCGTGAGSRER